MNKETKIMFPDEKIKLSTGETIRIKPLSFADLILNAELVATVMLKVAELKEKFDGADKAQALKIFFREAAGDALDIMAVVTGKPREWFSTIRYDEGLAIFAIICEQNIDESAKKNLKRAGALITPSQIPSKP